MAIRKFNYNIELVTLLRNKPFGCSLREIALLNNWGVSSFFLWVRNTYIEKDERKITYKKKIKIRKNQKKLPID